MKRQLTQVLALLLAMILVGCAAPPERKPTAMDQINAELNKGAQQQAKPAAPAAVAEALLPPLQIDVPTARSTEQRTGIFPRAGPGLRIPGAGGERQSSDCSDGKLRSGHGRPPGKLAPWSPRHGKA